MVKPLTPDEQKHLLGNLGSALVQKILAKEGTISYPPWDVLHRSIDLVICRDAIEEIAQIKTKVPWITEGCQSMAPHEWNNCQDIDHLYLICVPATNKWKAIDEWAGNIYRGRPSELRFKEQLAGGRRRSILIPLEQPKLTKIATITNPKILELMEHLTTQGE